MDGLGLRQKRIKKSAHKQLLATAHIALPVGGRIAIGLAGDKFHAAPWCALVLAGVGDSFSFKSTDVHRCANPGDMPVRVIWVITPPHY